MTPRYKKNLFVPNVEDTFYLKKLISLVCAGTWQYVTLPNTGMFLSPGPSQRGTEIFFISILLETVKI